MCVTSEISEALRRHVRALADADAEPWLALFASARFRVAPAGKETAYVCQMAEEMIATWL
jgi:hypothetical protein